VRVISTHFRDKLIIDHMSTDLFAKEHQRVQVPRSTVEVLIGSRVTHGMPLHRDNSNRHDGNDRRECTHFSMDLFIAVGSFEWYETTAETAHGPGSPHRNVPTRPTVVLRIKFHHPVQSLPSVRLSAIETSAFALDR
jgi:hypothetical protein